MKYDAQKFKEIQSERLKWRNYVLTMIIYPLPNEKSDEYLRRIMGELGDKGYCYIPYDEKERVKILSYRRGYRWSFVADGQAYRVTVKD